MSDLPDWNTLHTGEGCPLCGEMADVTDHNVKVADLSVSSLRLERNQTYRGYCVLIFKGRHVNGMEELTDTEYAAVTADLRRASLAVAKAMKPDHMNYATLGNVIPHLHFHIIPRYKGDPRWQAPVWTSDLADMDKTLLASDAEYLALAEEIRKGL